MPFGPVTKMWPGLSTLIPSGAPSVWSALFFAEHSSVCEASICSNIVHAYILLLSIIVHVKALAVGHENMGACSGYHPEDDLLAYPAQSVGRPRSPRRRGFQEPTIAEHHCCSQPAG